MTLENTGAATAPRRSLQAEVEQKSKRAITECHEECAAVEAKKQAAQRKAHKAPKKAMAQAARMLDAADLGDGVDE